MEPLLNYLSGYPRITSLHKKNAVLSYIWLKGPKCPTFAQQDIINSLLFYCFKNAQSHWSKQTETRAQTNMAQWGNGTTVNTAASGTQPGVLIVSFTLANKCERTSQRLKQINAAERICRALCTVQLTATEEARYANN